MQNISTALHELAEELRQDGHIQYADRLEALSKNIRHIERDPVVIIPVDTEVRLSTHTTNHTCPEGRENNETARIKGHLSNIVGGVVLDRDLHGCRYWNTTELVKVRGSNNDSN